MSTDFRPPLLAYGLTDAAPEILRAVAPDPPAPVAADAAGRPALLAYGLADAVPPLRAPAIESSLWSTFRRERLIVR